MFCYIDKLREINGIVFLLYYLNLIFYCLKSVIVVIKFKFLFWIMLIFYVKEFYYYLRGGGGGLFVYCKIC